MKKILFTCVIIFIIAYSSFFPEVTISAAQKGIEIWFQQILPALLPFTIISSILIKSNFLKSIKGNVNLVAILITLSCGFVFGFPIGAKLSADFYKENLLNEKQATLLAITTNNFSPMYVCGFALSLLFPSKHYITITYFLLYLTPLVIATYFIIRIKHTIIHKKTTSPFYLDMKVIDAGIINGFESLIKICGYIVLFSIFTEILTNIISVFCIQHTLWITIFLNNLEITNGIHLISTYNWNASIKYVLFIQAISFGGLSGIAQTSSILSDAKLSSHKYIIGKVSLSLLLTLLSVIYVFFIRLI